MPDKATALSLRLIGTYDSSKPPTLDRRILREAAAVHLGSGSANQEPQGTSSLIVCPCSRTRPVLLSNQNNHRCMEGLLL